VKINRKVLSELAISDPEAFAKLVQIASASPV
jgi:ribosomal protein L20